MRRWWRHPDDHRLSINDTIVIFDRIREDLKLGVRGTSGSHQPGVNQTLSRTIITSGTVFLATMSLYLFGGGRSMILRSRSSWHHYRNVFEHLHCDAALVLCAQGCAAQAGSRW